MKNKADLLLPDPGRLAVSVPEFAALIGISERSAYDITERADFPVILLGTRKIIPVDDLKVWLHTEAERQKTKRQASYPGYPMV